jgi:HlyD family secretion protein
MTRKKGNNKLLFILLAAVIVVLVGLIVWRNRAKPKGEKVTTELAEARVIKEKVAASGKVFPEIEVKISSDVSGEIVELFVMEGDSVVQGQLLANIDPDAYKSQVERGVAQVNSSKAQVANARSQVEQFKAQREQIAAQLMEARNRHQRNIQLKEQGVISAADFDVSLSNLQSLEANLRSVEASIKAAEESVRAAQYSVESAEASLRELRTSLRRTIIYAPVSGIISRLNVEKGERVVGTMQMAGTEMMRIANLNAMEVRVEVSESDIPRVSIGDEVEIEVDAYLDRKFKGQVTMIANSAIASAAATTVSLTSDQVTNFEVRINIDPQSYADLVSPTKPYPFRPGMSATVEINTATVPDALSVPIQAVTTREKKQLKNVSGIDDSLKDADLVEIVFLVRADTVAAAPVKTGIQDDTYIQILSGLAQGDQVVSGPYTAVSRRLKQGMRIHVVKEEELYGQTQRRRGGNSEE